MSSPQKFWLTFSPCPLIGQVITTQVSDWPVLLAAFPCGLFSLTWLLSLEKFRMSLQQKLVSLSQECEADRPPAVTRARRGQQLACDWSIVNDLGPDWSVSQQAEQESYLKSAGVKRLCKSFILIILFQYLISKVKLWQRWWIFHDLEKSCFEEKY